MTLGYHKKIEHALYLGESTLKKIIQTIEQTYGPRKASVYYKNKIPSSIFRIAAAHSN